MASSSTASHNHTEPENAFEQLAPFCAPKSEESWQIFINHRGPDVKHTLATKIHHTLASMGFRSFLDVEIEPGDAIPAIIQAAMETVSLHIAIFSPNYAQSPWCLAELAFMLKTDAKIIPIFYHVVPSDLRWIDQEKGKYAEAFAQHSKQSRYTEEKLREWKQALHNISFHSGYEVNNNEDEAGVLKHIMDCALKVFKSDPLWVAEHPLGLDKLVEGFESVASEHKVNITGIMGMGGSGKTTLAKELFNRHFSAFDRCSFVSEVRDAASRNALPEKQKKLLTDLGIHHLPFDSVDEGMAVLGNRLSFVRALIVLDDVDNIDQLNALLPYKDNLGSQSMVIVTTRELGVLQSWGLSCIYKMPGLNRFHAEQLFCWHAFKQPSPPTEFETLVEEFLNACDGLPLSLKVLGAQLYGTKCKAYWKSQLHKIARILPRDIQKRLKVSYDALDEEEREMFLDAACFLIGETESTAIALWDGSGWSGLHGLQTLANKCLVELYYEELTNWYTNPLKEGLIRMHDHLRDMGREIASRHSSYDRLWWPGQIHNMKTHFKTRKPIRGIQPAATFAAFKEYSPQLMGISKRRSKRLRLSRELQILHVEKNELTEEFASLTEHLVWLRWDCFGLRHLPSWFTLRHLSFLQLDDAHYLEKLWEDNVDPPLQLRKLVIWNVSNKLQRLPTSIGRLQYLKILFLKFQGSSLSEEFCGLHSLEYLHLCCPMLFSLPDCFGNLVNLKYIHLESFEKLSTLPDSFKLLINLEHLYVTCVAKLKLKLDVFENIRKLKFLGLMNCDELEDLPIHIVNQASLKTLDLRGCIKLRSSPANTGQLVNVQSLTMQSQMLNGFQASFFSFSSLKDIEIVSYNSKMEEECKQVFRVSISNDCCPNLQHFRAGTTFIGNKHLMEIETLPMSLESLSINDCKVLKNIRCLTGLVRLQKLIIYVCPQLEELSSFADLASLEYFEMKWCPKVEKIQGLQHCKSLKHLELPWTGWKVAGIQSLEKVEGLETLVLGCDTISALKPCIQSMKGCPREMCIEGRVSRMLEPVVNFLDFPDLAVVKVMPPSDEVEIQHSFDWDYSFCYQEGHELNEEDRKEVQIHLSPRKGQKLRRYGSSFVLQKEVVVRGRRERVVEAFNQLLAILE